MARARKRKAPLEANAVVTVGGGNDVNVETNLSEEEKKKREKYVKKMLKKEADLLTIREANKVRFREAAAGHQEMTTGPDRKPAMKVRDDMKPAFTVGDYVKVDGDTSANMNRPEGFGFVQEVRGVGAATIVAVKYENAFDSGCIHHEIPFESLTRAVFGQDFEALKPKRRRVERKMYTPPLAAPKQSSVEEDTRLPVEVLVDKLKRGASTNRKREWHREELGLKSEGKKQLNHTEKNQLLVEVMLLEQHIAGLGKGRKAKHGNKYKRSGKFASRKTQHDPVTLKYLVQHAWGLGNSYLCELKKQLEKQATERKQAAGSTGLELDGGFESLLFVTPDASSDVDSEGKPVTSVIDDYELAEKKYTASYLYAVNRCREQAEENKDSVNKATYTERFNAAKKEFESLDDGNKALWEGKRREHLLQQPRIKDRIIDAIRKNPKRSWSGIEADINHWCSDASIYRWVTSRPGYHLYCERVIPLLTDAQRLKHYNFAKRFLNN